MGFIEQRQKALLTWDKLVVDEIDPRHASFETRGGEITDVRLLTTSRRDLPTLLRWLGDPETEEQALKVRAYVRVGRVVRIGERRWVGVRI